MPPLANARHEAFARHLVGIDRNGQGMSQSAAYVAAGYESETSDAIWANASRLIRNDMVAMRVTELKEQASRVLALSRADVLEMMAQDRALARDCNQTAAAIHATELLGRELHGMFKATASVQMVGADDVAKLSTADLARLARELADKIGADSVQVGGENVASDSALVPATSALSGQASDDATQSSASVPSVATQCGDSVAPDGAAPDHGAAGADAAGPHPAPPAATI